MSNVRSGLLFILIEMNEDENYEVTSVIGGKPADEHRRSDAEWCEASLRESGVGLIFDEVPAKVAGAQSILVTGHIVGEDFNEYDEHFEVESIHKVTAMAEIRRVLAPMTVAQLVQTKRMAEWRNMECVFNVIRRGCR